MNKKMLATVIVGAGCLVVIPKEGVFFAIIMFLFFMWIIWYVELAKLFFGKK